MIFYNYYYLVYKLKTDDKLWIVDESDSEKDLIDQIYNYSDNDIEKYYIIKKKYTKYYLNKILNSKFKRFQLFKIDIGCKIVYDTE